MDLIITILPVVTKDLPISPRFTPYNFLSRCKFSTLTTRQPMVEFYLLTFPRFPLRKKEHKSYFGKNRTHDFRTSRCAGYLLDHSGDKPLLDLKSGENAPKTVKRPRSQSSIVQWWCIGVLPTGERGTTGIETRKRERQRRTMEERGTNHPSAALISSRTFCPENEDGKKQV